MKLAAGKTALRAAAVVVLVVAAVAGFGWYRESQGQRETDNAYVNADIGQISAQVTGQVARVRVRENDFVKAGDPLFELDARPFEVALEKAEARLALAQQTARQDGADIVAAQAEVARARVGAGQERSMISGPKPAGAQGQRGEGSSRTVARDFFANNGRNLAAGVGASARCLRRQWLALAQGSGGWVRSWAWWRAAHAQVKGRHHAIPPGPRPRPA